MIYNIDSVACQCGCNRRDQNCHDKICPWILSRTIAILSASADRPIYFGAPTTLSVLREQYISPYMKYLPKNSRGILDPGGWILRKSSRDQFRVLIFSLHKMVVTFVFLVANFSEMRRYSRVSQLVDATLLFLH